MRPLPAFAADLSSTQTELHIEFKAYDDPPGESRVRLDLHPGGCAIGINIGQTACSWGARGRHL